MSRKDEMTYPCASLNEALPELRRPPAPRAVKFKIQTAVGEYAQVVPYIDARLVYDRLDHVCGGNWTAVFEEVPSDLRPQHPVEPQDKLIHVRCRLTVFGVTREDVGEGHDPKAAVSDAVKRAAVQFGVARAIYAMRSPWLQEGDADSELRRNHKGRLVLDRRTDEWCRGRYEAWLEDRGTTLFGEPLDHGDDQRVPEHAPSEDPKVMPIGESPAKPVPEAVASSPYEPETVAALAGLVHDVESIDALTAEQEADVRLLVEVADRAAIGEEALAATLARLHQRDDTRAAAAWLRQRLIERANERQLLDRRAA